MKYLFVSLFVGLLLSVCTKAEPELHLFYFHNRYLENHEVEKPHPIHGLMEYNEIVTTFERAGFTVYHEIRNGEVDVKVYALEKLAKIDSLITSGVQPDNITIVGTSKGGYIAQYVSSYAKHTDLNYVFVASFQESDISFFPEINWSGRVLNIYDKSDAFGVSAEARAKLSTSKMKEHQDYELDTGLGHGFLFKVNTGWIKPIIAWAKEAVDN